MTLALSVEQDSCHEPVGSPPKRLARLIDVPPAFLDGRRVSLFNEALIHVESPRPLPLACRSLPLRELPLDQHRFPVSYTHLDVYKRQSLRRQLAELTEKLREAQNRNTELEGIASSQAERIRQLETAATDRKKAPATVIQRVVEVITKGLTRDEERWLTDLGTALQGGYDPLRDPLVGCKFEEICAEQDLADDFEQRGQVPTIRMHRRGILLFPIAIWAARLARQEYESERTTGILSRSSGGFGKRLVLSDEEFLCKLSGAQKRELERKLSGLERR